MKEIIYSNKEIYVIYYGKIVNRNYISNFRLFA